VVLAAALTSCERGDTVSGKKAEKIGVIFVIHGGMDTNKPQYMWDAAVQMWAYDHNHPVYNFVIWNGPAWPTIMNTETTGFARDFYFKYQFEYERIGGVDPYHGITDRELADMKAELDKNEHGITFEVEWAGWIPGDSPHRYPYPRFIYNPPSGKGDKCTYCGEKEKDGPWPDCDPNRYNVDGPAERLLKKGVSRIIMIDLTVGGVRFAKTFEAVQMTKRVLKKWNAEHGTSVPLIWVNDYSNLMERSYPTEPERWTRFLGMPTKDSHVLLKGGPNPVAEDLELAQLTVEGIEAAMSSEVEDSKTGVILMNHAIHSNNETFDSKIDDTTTLNKNIKSQLLRRHPKMDPANIVGAYGGAKEINPESGLLEYTREQRGDRLGTAYLYESDKQMPGEPWGYRYWEAAEYLKNRGVKHIVVGFPQITAASVLDLVEIPNQFAKEIGMKTWAKDYWRTWVDTDCGGVPCCFKMGGCADGSPYPSPRQTPVSESRPIFDPSLAYDVNEYGHLGYDPAKGPPNPDAPVQDQYTGTWAMWATPDDNPRVGKLLAKHVLNVAVNPMVYVTNGEVEGVAAGRSVTWEAHVVTGTPEYTYEWSIKEKGATSWSRVGDGGATWTWTPGTDDAGTYNIQCKVTDKKPGTGEVVWKGFEVSA
jgi:hypothetical protein